MTLFFKNSSRLEAFSDGVFAIAITLLVLEIKVPEVGEHASPAALWAALLHLWPSYLAYALAFSTILIAWIGHHMLISQVRQVSQRLLFANGFFLLTVAFLPFPTSLVAAHLRSESASAAAAFYALVNLLTSVAFYGLVQAILKEHPDTAGVLLNSKLKSLWGVLWCLLCAVVALLSPLASLVAVAVLWVWWTYPQFGQEAETKRRTPGR